MTMTKSVQLHQQYRLEARLEAYNVFNGIVWDMPDTNISSANFGKVTRKRIDGIGPRGPGGPAFRVLDTPGRPMHMRRRDAIRGRRGAVTALGALPARGRSGRRANRPGRASTGGRDHRRQGARLPRRRRVASFKGLRYGADTSTRRFRPPVPPAPWTGVARRHEFGADRAAARHARPADERRLPAPERVDAVARATGRRPVMVWFHPRRVLERHQQRARSRRRAARRRGDVVVVTVNHRLNVFGHLYLGEIRRRRLRRLRQRRHARPGAGAAVGARQHRGLRRRSPATSRSSGSRAAAPRAPR